MVFMYWATLFITFSSQWSGIKGSKEFTSCNKTLSINCKNNYEIVITNFNTTSHIGLRLLQQCNGHSECKVTSLDEECVKVTYWCRPNPKKAVILEMRKSSNFQLKLKQSTFSIISEGYFNGSYQNAENFKCKLSLKEMEEKRKLNLVIHELTCSVNSTEYCVQLKDTAERSFCSGPGKLHEKLKSSESSEWELVLAPADTELPNVRFWIEFNFVDEKSAMIILKCHTASTKPNGCTPKSSEAFRMSNKDDKNYVLNSAIGSILGLTLVAMSGLVIYIVHLRGRLKEITEHVYSEVDLQGNTTKPQRQLPQIPLRPPCLDDTTQRSENMNYDLSEDNRMTDNTNNELDNEDTMHVSHQEITDDLQIVDNAIYGSHESVTDLSCDIPGYVECAGSIKQKEDQRKLAGTFDDIAILSKQFHQITTSDTKTRSCPHISVKEKSEETSGYELCKFVADD